METVVAFDTHRFVKNLTANGFTERQAEALANEQVNLLNANLATKADIERIHERLERIHERIERIHERIESTHERIESTRERIESTHERIESTRERIERIHERIAELQSETAKSIENAQQETARRIAELKADLQRWIIAVLGVCAGIVLTAAGLVVAALRLLG